MSIYKSPHSEPQNGLFIAAEQHPRDITVDRRPITDNGVVEGSRCLLQSTEQGSGQRLLNSLVPQGTGGEGSYSLKAGRCLISSCPSSCQVSGAGDLPLLNE